MAFQSEADLPPGLKNMDSLLRCPICFDFLSIAMMAKCSHNFCSLCIRKFLSYKLQCPVCCHELTVPDLRNNRLLDDLVMVFQETREQLSKAKLDSPGTSPRTLASAGKCTKSGPKGSILSHFVQKGPKRTPQDAQQVGPAAPCVQFTQTTNDAAQPPLVVKEEPMDEESVSSTVPLPPSNADSMSPSEDIKPLIKVECPVCSVPVSQLFINKHLDTCLASGEKKASMRGSRGNTAMRPMGKLVYNLLSLHELRRKLKDCHLSAQGARDQLIKRHQEFVHIYNSQCDSLDPKSAEDIAKEVEANEKTRNQLQGKAKPVMRFSKNLPEAEIDEMHSNYRKQHSSEFSTLIAEVQGRLKSTRIKQEASEKGEEAQELHTAGGAAASKSSMLLDLEVQETGADKETPAGQLSRPASLSDADSDDDVSISSSLSDIFAPLPEEAAHRSFENATESRKETSSSSEEDAAPPVILGKRPRKRGKTLSQKRV